jgi:hypothetical protein
LTDDEEATFPEDETADFADDDSTAALDKVSSLDESSILDEDSSSAISAPVADESSLQPKNANDKEATPTAKEFFKREYFFIRDSSFYINKYILFFQQKQHLMQQKIDFFVKISKFLMQFLFLISFMQHPVAYTKKTLIKKGPAHLGRTFFYQGVTS